MYQMLVGKPPFEGSTAVVLMHCHLNEPPPRPSAKVAEIPKELDELVVKLDGQVAHRPSLGCGRRRAIAQRAATGTSRGNPFPWSGPKPALPGPILPGPAWVSLPHVAARRAASPERSSASVLGSRPRIKTASCWARISSVARPWKRSVFSP